MEDTGAQGIDPVFASGRWIVKKEQGKEEKNPIGSAGFPGKGAGVMTPSGGPVRKVGKGPFVLVVLVLGLILVFVGYPVQKIFLGGNLFSRSSPFVPPPKGSVGYLKVDEGYGIFASRDRADLILWERVLADPSGLMKAREMLRKGEVITLMPYTSVLSVDPAKGTLKILSGAEFGQVLFVSMDHVRFVPLHP